MILPNNLRNTTPWLSEFSRLFEAGLRSPSLAQRKLRIYEEEDSWTLEIDLPGVSKDKLGLKVEDRVLRLDGRREDSQELRYRLPLGEEVDIEAISASLDLGVLRIHLPRKARAHKQIDIL
ncbi:MAG: Hsp20/alpha crystallin family protein [Verrucomicrobiales bacterium]